MRKILATALTAALAFGAQTALATELVFATLNDNVRKQAERFAELEVYLEDQLTDAGVTSVTLEVFQTAEEVTAALKSQRAHFYYDSPLIAAKVGAPAGATMFLRRWKRGVGQYHSVIFVKSDSPIQNLSDLTGKTVAMQEPTSTSGFLLPLSLLAAEGLPVAERENVEAAQSDTAVNYVFTGDDKNTALWVVKGRVDAGATDNATFARLENAAPGQYRSIGKSQDVPRQVVMMAKGVDPALAEAVADVLTSMHLDEVSLPILNKFNKTTQFERFEQPPAAVMAPMTDILTALEAAGVGG